MRPNHASLSGFHKATHGSLRCALILLTLLLASSSRADEKERDWFAIPSVLMDSTFMIRGTGQGGQPLQGTAFVLAHLLTSDIEAKQASFVLLTAGHVLSEMTAPTATVYLRRFTNGEFSPYPTTLQIRDERGTPRWVSHPDADIAAMRLSVPNDAYLRQLRVLSTALLASDDTLRQYEIGPGDEVMTLGFPYGSTSNSAGFPILRSARIASYPLLPSKGTKTFLIDSPVFPGNSGGPVFLYDQNRFYHGKINFGRTRLVLGVVTQSRSRDEKVVTLTEETVRKHPLGLAVAVHASQVRELLETLFPNDPFPQTDVDNRP